MQSSRKDGNSMNLKHHHDIDDFLSELEHTIEQSSDKLTEIQRQIDMMQVKAEHYEDLQAFINSSLGYYDSEMLDAEELLAIVKVGVVMCEILEGLGMEAERFNSLSVNTVMELERVIKEVLR